MRNVSASVEPGDRASTPALQFRIPHSALRIGCHVSNCHTLAKPLDCPVKYAATIPPADLRDPRGPDGRADRAGRGGVGARRAHGGAVGGSARRARGDGRVGGRDARSPGDHAAPPPLPGDGLATRGAPEFEALRQALRELATALDAARGKELEAERLRAFREVARRVAHEIKNPLTSMRIAVDQLGRSGGPAGGRTTAVEVLAAETHRLERLAKEFSEFGRLPEGPKSEVDLVDLLIELGRSAVPGDVAVTVRANGAGEGPPCRLLGHYEPLRRAFSNLLRNAAEAMDGHGTIEIAVSPDGPGILVTIAQHGPGDSAELRHRAFEPYFTTKHDGTGLGLALVRQTVEAHNGSITVADTPGGGATFSIVLSAT